MDTMASALAVGDRLRTRRERGETDLTGYPTELVAFLRVNSSGSVNTVDFPHPTPEFVIAVSPLKKTTLAGA